MQRPNITIRMGASHNEIQVDQHVFSLKEFDHRTGEGQKMRNLLIDTLVKANVLTRKKKRERKAHRRGA